MDVDNHQRGVLHLAVEGGFSAILSVLLENGTDPDIMDEDGNNGKSLAWLLYCCIHTVAIPDWGVLAV